MTGRWTAAQERGLLLLLAAALLASGLTLSLPRVQPSPPIALPTQERIVLSSVTVVAPIYVDPWPVDVNTADAEELVRLKGIGPALASRIIEHRETYGPFASLDDLTRVQGIGPQTLAGLRGQAIASPSPAP